MDTDSPQQQRYPEPLNRPMGTYPTGQSISGPIRESEVQRELSKVQEISRVLQKQSEELIQRLSCVISPRDNEINKTPQETDYSPTTPLATNIKEVFENLQSVGKSFNFILSGLEL